jgi:hypothetical protein
MCIDPRCTYRTRCHLPTQRPAFGVNALKIDGFGEQFSLLGMVEEWQIGGELRERSHGVLVGFETDKLIRHRSALCSFLHSNNNSESDNPLLLLFLTILLKYFLLPLPVC